MPLHFSETINGIVFQSVDSLLRFQNRSQLLFKSEIMCNEAFLQYLNLNTELHERAENVSDRASLPDTYTNSMFGFLKLSILDILQHAEQQERDNRMLTSHYSCSGGVHVKVYYTAFKPGTFSLFANTSLNF